LILKTLFEDAAFGNNTTAVVPEGVKYVVLPVIVVTATMFGLAMFAP